MANFLRRLFWCSGRSGRLEFLLVGIFAWNLSAGWYAMQIAWIAEANGRDEMLALAHFLTSPLARMWALLSWIALWIAIANNFKRLHDFGWSGFWQFVPVLAFFCWVEFAIWTDGDPDAFSSERPARLLANLGFGIGGLVVTVLTSFFLVVSLLLWRGQSGANAYGPPPLWPRSKAVAGAIATEQDMAAS